MQVRYSLSILFTDLKVSLCPFEKKVTLLDNPGNPRHHPCADKDEIEKPRC